VDIPIALAAWRGNRQFAGRSIFIEMRRAAPISEAPTKPCQHCRSAIDALASVCPVCRRKQSNANGCGIVAAVGLGALALLIVFGSTLGPSAEVQQAADEAERAIVEVRQIESQYGADDEPFDLTAAGSGMIAGFAAHCGRGLKWHGRPGQGRPRAIRTGGVVVSEGDLGGRQDVFDELWRRAGC
jgi:hypothetical protein